MWKLLQTLLLQLQQCTMQKLRNELDLEAERSLHVPYSRFVELAIQRYGLSVDVAVIAVDDAGLDA